jgi:hypothetical protein
MRSGQGIGKVGVDRVKALSWLEAKGKPAPQQEWISLECALHEITKQPQLLGSIAEPLFHRARRRGGPETATE